MTVEVKKEARKRFSGKRFPDISTIKQHCQIEDQAQIQQSFYVYTGKVLLINGEGKPERTTVILVKENLGF